MTEQVAWLGKTLNDQAEDAAVAAYKRTREAGAQALTAAIERQRRRQRRQAVLLNWIAGAVAVSGLLVVVGPFLIGLGWLLRRWLG